MKKEFIIPSKSEKKTNHISSLDLTQVLPEPIIEIDINGQIVFINEFGKKKFNLSDEELEKGIPIFSIVYENDRLKCQNCFEEIKQKKEAKRFTFRLVCSEGMLYHAFFNMTPIFDNGELVGFVGIIQDTTELTKAESKLNEFNSLLERRVQEETIQMESKLKEFKTEISIRKKLSNKLQIAKEDISKAFRKEQDINEMKSSFISMITHEFKTPLTIILSSANMLEQFYNNGNEEKLFKHLEKIKKSSNNLAQLIERTITLSKNEAGVLKLFTEEFDLLEFFKVMMNEIKLFDKDKHKVSFYANCDTLTVITDRNLLTMIFNNIISNSLKYTEENNIVDILVNQQDDIIEIDVSDEGIGIPKDELDKLFEPFYRCSNVDMRQGSGLGLSIVRKCLNLIQGSISISSIAGTGTKAFITIPKKI